MPLKRKCLILRKDEKHIGHKSPKVSATVRSAMCAVSASVSPLLFGKLINIFQNSISWEWLKIFCAINNLIYIFLCQDFLGSAIIIAVLTVFPAHLVRGLKKVASATSSKFGNMLRLFSLKGTTTSFGRKHPWFDRTTYRPYKGYKRYHSSAWNMAHTMKW